MISYQYLSLAMEKSLANKTCFPTNTGKNELEQNEKNISHENTLFMFSNSLSENYSSWLHFSVP